MSLSLFHLHGNFKEQPFPRLLAGLRTDRFTGVLQANSHLREVQSSAATADSAITREIHFFEGHIAWAISTDPEESLKAYLLRHSAVSEQQWAEAEAAAGSGTLRQALVESGPITARELSQMEKGRIETIVLSLFPAGEGEYRVRERQLPPGTPDLKLDPRPLLLKGMMEAADLSLIMEEVGSLDSVPVSSRGTRSDADASLPGEFQTILRHVDGRNTVAAIIAATGLPDNYVCTVVAALSMVGTIRRQPAGWTRGEKTPQDAVEATATPPASHQIAAAPPPFLPLSSEIEMDAEITLAMATVSPKETPLPILQPTAHTLAVASRMDASAVETTEPGQDDTSDSKEVTPDADPETEDFTLGEDHLAGPGDPTGVAGNASPVYDAAGHERSRPWFLLGGAAAVAFAMLFLILMSHDGDDAVEFDPVAPSLSSAALAPGPMAEEPDDPESDRLAFAETPPIPAPRSSQRGIALPPPAPMLESGSTRTQTGQRRLHSGDFAGAAELFREEYRSGSDGYTIQLMAACEDESVERALKSAGGAGSLFILPARVAGKSCYRVYWGHYATASIAQEALHRDVPSVFRKDRNPPRITRLPG